jgi:gas vesicle protein
MYRRRNKMKKNDQEFEYHEGTNTTIPLLAGLVVGSLAGAATMLLLAPQSGRETRAQIQQKTMELRDRTTQTVEEAMMQARNKTHQITSDIRGKAEELQQQGQEMAAEQLDRVAAAAEAGKTALKSSEARKTTTTKNP